MLSNITRRFYSATASNMAAKKLQVGWVSVSPRTAAIAATADKQEDTDGLNSMALDLWASPWQRTCKSTWQRMINH